MTEDELKLRDELDKIYNSLELNDVVSRIIDLERQHITDLIPACGRFISQFEYCYNLIVNLMYKVNFADKSKWPIHRWYQYLILHSNLNSIYSSFNRTVRGFYFDSPILIRPVYEAFVMCIFITAYPETHEYIWLDDKTLNKYFKGKRRFHANDFIKKDLKLQWTKYDLLSKSTHINRLSMIINMKEYFNSTSDKKKPIGLKILLDKETFSLGANFINYILYVYLKFITTFFLIEPNVITTEGELERARHLTNLLRETFKFHTDYWSEIASDTNDIFEMMVLAEKGEDWKSIWERRRRIPSE